MWSRIQTIFVAADRYTAAKYGFDDKVFYDEVEEIGKQNLKGKMVELIGVAAEESRRLFSDTSINRTKLRRGLVNSPADVASNKASDEDLRYMRLAIKAAEDGAKRGSNKEREPFGACIVNVKTNVVVATACNTVMKSRDATATAEINAIRQATVALDTHILEDCIIYCTALPDVMSVTALLWARIPKVYFGLSQQAVAEYGFEEGVDHYRELCEVPEAKRKVTVVRDILKPTAEEVFQYWEKTNAQLY